MFFSSLSGEEKKCDHIIFAILGILGFFVGQKSSSWGVTQAWRTYVGVVVEAEQSCVFNRMNIGYNISYKVFCESYLLQKIYFHSAGNRKK